MSYPKIKFGEDTVPVKIGMGTIRTAMQELGWRTLSEIEERSNVKKEDGSLEPSMEGFDFMARVFYRGAVRGCKWENVPLPPSLKLHGEDEAISCILDQFIEDEDFATSVSSLIASLNKADVPEVPGEDKPQKKGAPKSQ